MTENKLTLSKVKSLIRGTLEEVELDESHFRVGDKVRCKESGMDGEITKIDKEDGDEDEKYYTFKREDGKVMKKAPKELSKMNEAKYPGFRVRSTIGGPKLPRRTYVPQGDQDPRTGMPLGFSPPPIKKDEPKDKNKKVKEEVEVELIEVSAEVAKRVAQRRDQDFRKMTPTETQKRRMGRGDWRADPSMHADKSYKSAVKRGAKDVYGYNEETMSDTEEKMEMASTQAHFIKYAAEEIIDYINMNGEIEEWYQNKLSKVHSDMEGLHSWVEGEKRRTGMVKEEDMKEAAIHPMAVHVKPSDQRKDGRLAYKVHAVGAHLSDGLKAGEHLSDTELDDLSDIGAKIKHVKEGKSLSAILEMAKRGRPRKNPAEPAKRKSGEDEDDDLPDVGPEADQNITVHLKKTMDNEKHVTNFSDGSKHVVAQHVAQSVHDGMMKLKPEQRKQVQDHIQQSHKNLMDVHAMLKGR